MVDEGAWITKQAYEEALLPTLADSNGPLLVITTPAGRRGWVWEEYCRAVKGEKGYGYLSRPSTDNPNPKIRQYVAFRRARMQETAFAQEFLAEFTEDATALFRNIDHAVGGQPEAPAPQIPYLSGADLGKSDSWTVQYTARLTGAPPFQIVNEDRFQLLDWPDQVRRAKATCGRYNGAPLVVDATGVGDAVLSMMREERMAVRGVRVAGRYRPLVRPRSEAAGPGRSQSLTRKSANGSRALLSIRDGSEKAAKRVFALMFRASTLSKASKGCGWPGQSGCAKNQIKLST